MTAFPIAVSSSLGEESPFGDRYSVPNQGMNHDVQSKVVWEIPLVSGFPTSLAAMGNQFYSMKYSRKLFLTVPVKSILHWLEQWETSKKYLCLFHALTVVIREFNVVRETAVISGQEGKPKTLERYRARTLLTHLLPLNFYYVR